jgi:hypothetical protein
MTACLNLRGGWGQMQFSALLIAASFMINFYFFIAELTLAGFNSIKYFEILKPKTASDPNSCQFEFLQTRRCN